MDDLTKRRVAGQFAKANMARRRAMAFEAAAQAAQSVGDKRAAANARRTAQSFWDAAQAHERAAERMQDAADGVPVRRRPRWITRLLRWTKNL